MGENNVWKTVLYLRISLEDILIKIKSSLKSKRKSDNYMSLFAH